LILKNILSLDKKIIILLSALITSLTFILTTIYLNNIGSLIDSNIEFYSNSMMKNEKKALEDKIELAVNILKMYYEKTTPKYMEGEVKNKLTSHQEQLFSQLNNLYNKYKNKLTEKELQNKLKDIVKYARYSNNGYFWINNFKNKMIMHPIKPQYDGKYFVDTPLVPFVELGSKKLKKLKTDSAFIKYKFYNPATKKYEFKVSLVRVFKPYGWIIGTGRYLSDVTPMVQQDAINDIKAFRYGKDGYFWINNMNYKMIMHPIKPQYDGKFFINTPKVPFVKLGVDALKKSNTDNAVIKYRFYNPATKKYENKLSVVKLFKPWNLVIGSGIYLNNIEKSIEQVSIKKDKEQTKLIFKIILISIFIIFIITIISYYLTIKFIVEPMQQLHNQKEYFEEIANIDYLTNVFNRRAFYDRADQYFAYARRNDIEVSVMMIDIDYFKKVNDTYGHEAGDIVLQKLSKIVTNSIREEDIFGRLGGEEFGICILNSNKFMLCNMAQKIRHKIEDTTVLYKGTEIKFTISIGCHNLYSKQEDFETALNKADKALYKAKTTGRNKVEMYKNITLCKTIK